MTARVDHRLEEALRDLTAALRATRAPWMIIGGIAVIAHGVRRFTADIDAAIRGDQIDIASLIEVLAKRRIVPRIARAEAFAHESLVLLLRHERSGVEFDVSLAWTDFEHQAIAAASVAPFGTVMAPMARPEDLIVFKSIAARGKDIDDVIALLTLYPTLDLSPIRARVRELAALADAPELAAGLETAIAGARAAQSPRKRMTKPKSSRTANKAKKPKKKKK